MEQVHIEIFDPAFLQLIIENFLGSPAPLQQVAGQLGGNGKAVPGIPLHQSLAQERLAFVVEICIGCVKIPESPLQKQIHHFLRGIQIHIRDIVGIHMGQAQKAKTKATEIHIRSSNLCFLHYNGIARNCKRENKNHASADSTQNKT